MIETLQTLFSNTYVQYATLGLVVVLVTFIHGRYRRELAALDEITRNRLFSDFTRYRAMHEGLILFILLPVVIAGMRIPWLPLAWDYAFLLSALVLVLWAGVAHFFLRAKLTELRMPEAFTSAFISDRLVMALTLGLVLGYAWLNLMPIRP